MRSNNNSVGKIGEDLGCQYLISQGYKIIEVNFYSHWGELDIIAEKKAVIHFVEVKTRRSKKYGMPSEAVTYGKLKRLKRTIDYYIMKNKLQNRKMTIDVIGIILASDHEKTEIKLYENVELG